MDRFAAALILLLSLGHLNSQQPAASDAQIASRIAQTASQFQSRTQRYATGSWYPAGALNSILAQTRQQLLDDLPPDAAPLRAYILQQFPRSIPDVAPSQKINMKICGPYLDSANDILNSLKSVNAYRLDLIVDSTPSGAIFEFKPVAGETLSGASRGTLSNVWRGIYTYTAAKDGHKTITGKINLIREKGNQLRCTFVSKDSTDQAMPCQLVTAP